MGDAVKLEIDFSALGDLLSIWASKVPDKGGARIVTMEPDISSFYSSHRECVGIYWFDACRILLPVLERGDMTEVKKYPELVVDHFRETDTLNFGNREAVVGSQEMTPGLIAHFDLGGLACSLTMENASAILLHHFSNPVDEVGFTPVGTAASETQE